MSEETGKRIDFIVKVFYYLIILGIAYLAFKVFWLVFPFIIAMGLVAVFQPVIHFIHRKFKVNRKIISVILMALLYTGAGGLIFWLVLRIIYLLRDLFTWFPDYYRNSIAPTITRLGDWLDGFFANLQLPWGIDLSEIQTSLMDGIQNFILSISQKGVSFITNFINAIPSFFMILIFTVLLSFFISFHYDKVIQFIKNQMPVKAKKFVSEFKSLLKGTVFRYIKAYLILMTITFTELIIGFLITGTPNPIGMAAIIALFDALPVFGTGGIMIPWIIIELIQGNIPYAVALAVLYAVITVVRNIIEPKVVGDQLGINPIVSLIAVYIGFKLFGAFGMIVFPILAQILLALHQNGTIRLYKEKRENSNVS